MTRVSPSDFFFVITRALVGGWVKPLCRDAVGVFYSPSQLSTKIIGFPYIEEVKKNQEENDFFIYLLTYS